MAEPFGIASGAVGIATCFSSCVDLFNYVQCGRHWERDYRTCSLDIDNIRSRWEQALKLSRDPKSSQPDTTLPKLENACLKQVQTLLANSEKILQKYKVNAEAKMESSSTSPNGMDPKAKAHPNTSGRKVQRVLQKARWALHDKGELKSLISDSTSLMDGLERNTTRQPQSAAAQRTNTRDKQHRGSVQTAAHDLDSQLQVTKPETSKGHRYSKVVIEGKGQAGDLVHEGWEGDVKGPSHDYRDVHVGLNGRGFVGNIYGGRSFWDD